MLKENLTVLVSSCDQYQDILDPFSVCFHKFWPNCPLKVVLTTESYPIKTKNWVFDEVVASGKEKSWCERLCAGLNAIDTPYILLILDDFFLSAPVQNEQMENLLAVVKKYHAAHMRLEPLPKPQRPLPEEGVGEYVRGHAYRVSAQVAIWDREYLIKLLQEMGKSELWYFERQGSFASEKYEQISLGCYRVTMPYVEIICAARWLRSGVKFCKNENIPIQRALRNDEPLSFWLYRKVRGVIFHLCPTLITKIKLKITKGAPNGR